MSKPLSERQQAILLYLEKNGTETPSHIAYGIGMNKLPPVTGSGRGSGRGSGYRVFNPAQRIISSLVGLRNRGLIGMGLRPDGRTGTAYGLTPEGEREAERLREASDG